VIGFLLGALAAVFVEGSTSMWTDGTHTWAGNRWCKEAGFIPTSPDAIDKGAWIEGFHCPVPGPDPSGCAEWTGSAPDIGACELFPTPPPPAAVATLLGQTGEDISGTTTEGADGIPDVHILLVGAPAPITHVRIVDDDVGVYETPFNGANWIVAIRPQADPSRIDLFFDFWQPTAFFILDLTFANGTMQTVQTRTVLAPEAPQAITIQ
jgi:hypothetical protein